MTIDHARFRHDLIKRLDGIKRLCKQRGVPELAGRVTLILRDPTNDQMSFVLTDEATVTDACRVARLLEERDDE